MEEIDIKVKLQELAKITEGLSGREIAKLVLGWQVTYFQIDPDVDGVHCSLVTGECIWIKYQKTY